MSFCWRNWTRLLALTRLSFTGRSMKQSITPKRADMLKAAGVRAVLTSGGQSLAAEGLSTIEETVQSGMEVVAGAGVQPDQVADFVRVGVEAVHASCRVSCGSHEGRLFDAARTRVDEQKVRALVEAVRAVARP